jgi:hypothetical protein
VIGALDDHARHQAIADANPNAAAWLGVLAEFRRHRVFEEFIHRERQRNANNVAARGREKGLIHDRQSIARAGNSVIAMAATRSLRYS